MWTSLKTDSQFALADMINHFLTEQADRLDSQSALADKINHFLTEQADRLDVSRDAHIRIPHVGLLYFTKLVRKYKVPNKSIVLYRSRTTVLPVPPCSGRAKKNSATYGAAASFSCTMVCNTPFPFPCTIENSCILCISARSS